MSPLAILFIAVSCMLLQKSNPLVHCDQVKYIYFLRSQAGEPIPECQRHIPDGTFELIMSFGSPIFHTNSDGIFLKRPDNIFIGGYKKFHAVKYTGCIRIIGVVFHQGYASHIAGDRMNQEKEFFVQADQIFGKEVNDLSERLQAIDDMATIRALIEKYLSQVIPDKLHFNHERIAKAMDHLLAFGGNVRVRDLAGFACMSERNFRRVFGEITGYSPIEMTRIVRAKRLIHLIKSGIPTRKIIRMLGYYDPSHILHDFRALGGTTPRDYLSQMNDIDTRFFEQSEYAIRS